MYLLSFLSLVDQETGIFHTEYCFPFYCTLHLEQLFRMYNGSTISAHFTVDLRPFKRLRDENFGHDVISVGQECGTIPPLSWSSLPLRFSPIEYKDYMVISNYHPLPLDYIYRIPLC